MEAQESTSAKVDVGQSLRADLSPANQSQPSSASDKSTVAPWISSSVLIAAFSAVSALLGTGIGAALQGYWNTKLERQKFEAALITKALETADKNEAARNLLFLVDAGLIQQYDSNKIRNLAKNPNQLPVLTGSLVRRAKIILKAQGLYSGEVDDNYDAAFSQAVRDFQKSVGMTPDGMVGLQTLSELLKRYQK